MSAFWSGWIIGLMVVNLGIAFLLFLWAQRVSIPTQSDGTTGHVWAHGVLREAVRRLPLWWVIVSALLFVWAVAYLALYPGLGAFPGALAWTSSDKHARDSAANDARLERTLATIRGVPIATLAQDRGVVEFGRALFEDNCAACHGRDARGRAALGSPNLVDGNSLYGNDPAAILESILEGRNGVMPPLGGVLGHQGANEAAAYVLTLNGYQAPPDWVAAGRQHFETLCSACHGADGQGNHALGAPDLTDDVWLYGRDFNRIAATIRDGRTGTMPAFRTRLGEERARAVAAWVYARGQLEIRPDADERT
jgi:cytochrome c oxidase cbb3-type subunit 3